MAKRKVVNLDELISGLKEPEAKYVRSGCVPWDLLSGGMGLRLGYLYQFYSPSYHGKSTVMLSLCRSLADRGHKSLYVASEKNDDLAASMGLTQDKYAGLFGLYPIVTYKDLEEVTWSFFESDRTLMVIDSITACFPSKIIEEGLSIEDSLPGINARIRGDYLRIIQGLIQTMDKTIIYLNQTRANFDAGWGGDPEKPEGGYANTFYCMVQATIRGDAKVPDLVAGEEKRIVGKQGYLCCPKKNRIVSPGAKIPLQVIFGKGVSNIYSLTHYLTWRGLVVGKGAWFEISWNGSTEKVSGKSGRRDWVREHQDEVLEDLYANASDYYDALLSGVEVKI
jgi:RecA/RadA recombinase